MKVFVDTSAFYASFTPDDRHFTVAESAFRRLVEDQMELATTNYVLLECASLIQKRKGFSCAERFWDKTQEGLLVIWIDEFLHRKAYSLWREAGKRELSFVDCASFAAMRHGGIRKAFAFDKHFKAYGFEMMR